MDSSPEIDARLTRLEHDLAAVLERLRALEAPGTVIPAAPLDVPVERTAPAARDMTGLASLLGRTFIVFGGAYLLRALTESGRLPNSAGILIGLAYAVLWLAASLRDVQAGRDAPVRRISAQFHGVTALLIGLPVVWEATTRFGFLGPGASAFVLGALATIALVVARRGGLHLVSGVAGFGTLAVAIASAWATDHYGPAALLLIGLATATYWLAEDPARGWLRWPTAMAAGLAVMGVTMRAIATPAREPAGLALVAQAMLLATMQGSLAVRVLMLGRNMRLFDILQAASGLVIGVGGAVLVARDSPAGLGLIGAVTAILASGAYLGAFFRLADRPHLLRTYHTFAMFGMVAVVTALVLLLSGTALAAAALVLASATIALGARRFGGYAPLHAAAYITTALGASGVLWLATQAWTHTLTPWPGVPLLAWVILAATAACATLQPPQPGELGDLLARSGRLIMAFACVFSLGGVFVILLAPLVAGTPVDAGILASLRTALLSLVVVGLGTMARWPTLAIFSRLVYPVLILGGVRLLADDFRHSRPSTLFVALALYGLAWALGPRLAARGASGVTHRQA